MLSHAVCFRHFWTPYFVKGHILRRDMPAFFVLCTPISYGLWIQDKGSFVLGTPVSGTATYAYSSNLDGATPGMYNEAEWRQYYRLNIDGIGGAGGYTYGVDGLGYGFTPGTHDGVDGLYNEMIRLGYSGDINFAGAQDSIRGV